MKTLKKMTVQVLIIIAYVVAFVALIDLSNLAFGKLSLFNFIK
jgi:nucleoside permease NupC